MTNIFFDLEADGLYHEWEPDAASRIDCCVALVEHNGDHWLNNWQGQVPKQGPAFVIGHNIIDYDLPMLAKHWQWDYSLMPDKLNGLAVRFIDTMLLSKLLNPDRQHPEGYAKQWKPSYPGQSLPGPHSLDAWGYRLGIKKPQLVYGPNMGHVPHEVSVAQAKADIEITRAVYYALMQEAKLHDLKLKKPLQVEQTVRHIITEGATEGVWFDSELAEECLVDLDSKLQELAERVEPQLPRREPTASKVKLPPKKRFKKDGSPSALAVKYFGEYLQEDKDMGWVVRTEAPFAVPLRDWPEDKPFGDQSEPITMGNQQDIKQWLIDEHGWKPTIWNTKVNEEGKKEKTSPKFQQAGKLCEHLQELGDIVPIVKDIVLWLSYRNRRNVIKSENGTGWLNHPRLPFDHRLPADADTMGTGTFRFTHRVVANIPRPSSTYGEQMRSLFKAPPGMVIVGGDASQLEDRCKAHYCYKMPGGKEYADKILDPEFDVHSENAENWGMERQKTKNGHYALQYACRPQKLADTLGIDLTTAEQYYEDWWSRNEPLRELTKQAEIVWEGYGREFLPAIDGRLVPTRKKHALVNTLLQSAGAIAMKYAMVWWWTQIRKLQIPAKQVIHYHDEYVAICPEEYAEQVGQLGCESIKQAGKMLGFRVALLSDYHIGQSWRDVH